MGRLLELTYLAHVTTRMTNNITVAAHSTRPVLERSLLLGIDFLPLGLSPLPEYICSHDFLERRIHLPFFSCHAAQPTRRSTYVVALG